MTDLEFHGLPDEKPLEQVAYKAYADHAEWTEADGTPMLTWDGLDATEQAHWCAAAQAVFGVVQAGFTDRLREVKP